MKITINSWKQAFEGYLQENPLDDGGHDLSHFKRVWRVADQISNDDCDKLVILAACYFHDIVNYPKNHPKRFLSSRDAAIKTEEILNEMNFPQNKIPAVKHCIEAHSFSANIKTKSKEAQIVQDADRMESLGAIGLARTFYTAGRMNSKLFSADDPFGNSRTLDDKLFALDHFKIKLLKLPDTMQTEMGKVEAIKRATVLENFLEELKNEL